MMMLIGLAVIIPTLLYVGLELDTVQRRVTSVAESELSKLLDADVSIGNVSIAPFNRVWLRDVSVTLHPDCLTAKTDTVAHIRRLGAGIDLYRLLAGKLVIGYAELIGADLRIRRDSASAPLNIAPILKALAPRSPRKEPSRYDLRINSVVLRQIRLSYDISDRPVDTTRIDPSHLAIYDLRADIRLPRLSNDTIKAELKRLAFTERSGLRLNDLRFNAQVTPDILNISGLSLQLPESSLNFSPFVIPLPGQDPATWINRLDDTPITLATSDSYVTPADIAPLFPELSVVDFPLQLRFNCSGTLAHIELQGLSIGSSPYISLEITDCLADSILHSPSASSIDIRRITLSANAPAILSLMRKSRHTISQRTASLLTNVDQFNLSCSGNMEQGRFSLRGEATTAPGSILFDAFGKIPHRGTPEINASVSTDGLALGKLLDGAVKGSSNFGNISFKTQAQVSIGASPSGVATLHLGEFTYRGRTVNDLHAMATISGGDLLSAHLLCSDPDADIDADIELSLGKKSERRLTADLDINHLDMSLLGLKQINGESPCVALSARARISGSSIDNAMGHLTIDDIDISSGAGSSHIDSLRIDILADTLPKSINISSDILRGSIIGMYTSGKLVGDFKSMLYAIMPSLTSEKDNKTMRSDTIPTNVFDISLQVMSLESLTPLVKLPVTTITPVSIDGAFDNVTQSLDIEIDAPFLRQGNKIIESTRLMATIDGTAEGGNCGTLNITSLIPAKKGKTRLNVSALGYDNHIDAGISWLMDRDREFSGRLDISTWLRRDEQSGKLLTDLHFNPGRLVFNDTAWTMAPSDVYMQPGHIDIDGFEVRGFNGQHLRIDGRLSTLPTDSAHIDLDRIDLDYIFETLEINNVMFGGRATGNFYAVAALSPNPRLYTDNLHVQGIKYNNCTMGDAEIKSAWDNTGKAVTIYADITGPYRNTSIINGSIKPMSEELDFRFHADRVPVGFLLPFMEAFTSDMDGHASGDAHLYGTFKLLDMTGDIFADAFKMKVDFTNCWYETTDSIHMRPGRIEIPGVILRDMYGNTGRFSGLVTHRCFKQPTFDFNITDCNNLLVYDMGKTPDYRWYGRIFGDGEAHIKGVPGRIDINVAMATAPRSTFTFELSDAEQAYDYTFITFRDRNISAADTVDLSTPAAVRELRAKLAKHDDNNAPSVYALDFTVDVNPNTAVTMVMDPVGGDRIRARGNGTLNMKYNSIDENLDIHGSYTLTEGNYNFTLQDIIIKDFTIKEGSKIEFFGDPYNARLAMEAIYQLNANLTDLDESFQQDKEISRTNVPLQAILMVNGEISQPEIKFDLRFPTLTDDTYRKVKSIISTDDMMNRQIIYLLALNRFYTPEYTSGTRGNELVSVASSTISSQLSNLLGQLSDNWTIAPNFRSDRGDFSDVEFDVALSSRLLNNRLLLNGNFGYRDKALNNNSFIGDFDIEYLLNRSGSLRLKAYNRYNDRNFYIKSALTTQGVGIIYKRDFDSLSNFLRRRSSDDEPDTSLSSPADSTDTDSIPQTIKPNNITL